MTCPAPRFYFCLAHHLLSEGQEVNTGHLEGHCLLWLAEKGQKFWSQGDPGGGDIFL